MVDHVHIFSHCLPNAFPTASPLRSAEEDEPVARESVRSKASRVSFVKEPTSFTGSYHDEVGSSKVVYALIRGSHDGVDQAPSVVCLEGGELVSQHAEEVWWT